MSWFFSWCAPKTSTYEFTAFVESDLLQGNDCSLGCGDCFVMPQAATTCISVTDDDGSMSGDGWWIFGDEHASDHSYQTANITTADGSTITSNNPIYVERYHVLKGSDGCYYYLIEMETEVGDAPGKGDDYFTFWGAVPPAGVSLTVKSTCESKGVDYACLGAGPKNAAPVAEDDAATVCASESVTINVLANDSDANNDALTITNVDGQAISEGGSVVLSNGVVVTLTGGQLVVDTGNVYDLDIDESEDLSFNYEVSDGNGGTSIATTVVTVKGERDTLEEVEESLPTGPFDWSITEEGIGDFEVTISGTGTNLDGTTSKAYCLEYFDDFITGLPLTATATIADTDLDTTDGITLGTGFNGQSGVDNLDLVNWIINQDFTSQDNGDGTTTNYTDAEIQGAIWLLTDGADIKATFSGLPPFIQPPGYFESGAGATVVNPAEGTGDNAFEIALLATLGGEGFEASGDDLVGIYIDPQSPDAQEQAFIVAADLFEECVC